MKEYKVYLSNQAKEDIANIYGYILNNLKSEINADAVLNRPYSAIEKLSFLSETIQKSRGYQKTFDTFQR